MQKVVDPAEMPRLVGPDVLAKLFGITRRRVNYLVNDRIIEQEKRGIYDLFKCASAYIGNLRDQAVNGSSEKQDYQALIAKQRAEKLVRENQVAAAELIPRAEVVAALQTALAHCRARLLAIPSKATPGVVVLEKPGEIRELLTSLINEALEEISETRFVALRESGDGARRGSRANGGGTGNAAASRPHGKRVGRPKSNVKPRGKRGAR